MRILLAVLMISTPVMAQSLAGSVGLFVYPPEEKTPSERQQDDYHCFAWAKGETGYDPMNPGAPAEVSDDNVRAEAGSGTRGALRGAARGAIIGEIVDDDASDGAAAGAALGMMRARSQSRRHQQEQIAQQNAQNQANFASKQDDFKKAMGLCLEARGYAVK